MKLYIVQHGEALHEDVDPDRPLAPEGKRDIRKIAGFLSAAGIHMEQIWHSRKRRSSESAIIFQEGLKPPGGILQMNGLDPGAEIGPLLSELGQEKKDLMIVGHLPFLQKMVSFLLTGKEDIPLVTFQKGCVL